MQTFKQFSNSPTIHKTQTKGQINIELVKNINTIGEAILSLTADQNGLWLRYLYIKPEYRGQGYVRQLMNEVDKIAQEKNLPIFLRVWSDDEEEKTDEELMQMYQKFGFVQIPNKPLGTMIKK